MPLPLSFDAPSEFREDEDQYVLAGVVLLEVCVQVVYAACHVSPECLVERNFVGMGVEASVLGVADAGSDVGGEYLCRVPGSLREWIGSVLDVGGVHIRHAAQDVRAFESVETGLAEEVHHRATAYRVSVHVAEGFEGLSSLVSTVHVVEQAVGAEIRYRGDGSVLRYERPGQRGCKVYSGDYVVRIGVHFAHSLAEPAFVADLRGFGGVPDVHRTEVGPVGHRVTHAVDDRNFAIVVQFLDGAHCGVEPVLVVQGITSSCSMRTFGRLSMYSGLV